MIRKTLTILSLIGLLLSVGLWGMESFYVFGYVSRSYLFDIGDGSLVIAYAGSLPAGDTGLHWRKRRTARIGLAMPQYFKPAGGDWGLKLPLWIATVGFAIGPISFILLPFHRRRKRKKLGLCLKCGYDLRGSKDICPECGESFE